MEMSLRSSSTPDRYSNSTRKSGKLGPDGRLMSKHLRHCGGSSSLAVASDRVWWWTWARLAQTSLRRSRTVISSQLTSSSTNLSGKTESAFCSWRERTKAPQTSSYRMASSSLSGRVPKQSNNWERLSTGSPTTSSSSASSSSDIH